MAANDTRPDWGYRGVLLCASTVGVWLLAMPFSGAVQQVALNRFHLQTSSLWFWALQVPVPAMYNFYNRFRVESPPDVVPPGPVLTGTLNHFPVRLYTFGESRGYMLRDRARHVLTVESRYRGRSLTTRWSVVASPDGRFELLDEIVRD